MHGVAKVRQTFTGIELIEFVMNTTPAIIATKSEEKSPDAICLEIELRRLALEEHRVELEATKAKDAKEIEERRAKLEETKTKDVKEIEAMKINSAKKMKAMEADSVKEMKVMDLAWEKEKAERQEAEKVCDREFWAEQNNKKRKMYVESERWNKYLDMQVYGTPSKQFFTSESLFDYLDFRVFAAMGKVDASSRVLLLYEIKSAATTIPVWEQESARACEVVDVDRVSKLVDDVMEKIEASREALREAIQPIQELLGRIPAIASRDDRRFVDTEFKRSLAIQSPDKHPTMKTDKRAYIREATFPAKPTCVVYLVVDEVQVIYREGDSSPRRKSSSFWEMIKSVLSNKNSRVRILMFAAYGSRLEYLQLATPVKLEDDIVLGIDQLCFSHAEVSAYVQKWFKGTTCFEGSSLSAMEEFCYNLEELTGGHVGHCMTTIRELNKVYASYNRSARRQPLPAKWIRMLQTGSLYRDDDNALFEALTSTRAVRVLNTLGSVELDELDRIAYGAASDFDAGVVEQCLRKGILVHTEHLERRFEFSSPVMWRFFVNMRVGDIVRALHVPKSLPETIARVVRSIDYDSIRNTLGRSLASDIPLERAWQMEFYKAAYRCTPSTLKTSADVGALFGSSGFVDFTIHGGDNFWGIELLREASSLAEHIQRFSAGGRYSTLPFTDLCLVDFRCID